jgi:hypothetical protein
MIRMVTNDNQPKNFQQWWDYINIVCQLKKWMLKEWQIRKLFKVNNFKNMVINHWLMGLFIFVNMLHSLQCQQTNFANMDLIYGCI